MDDEDIYGEMLDAPLEDDFNSADEQLAKASSQEVAQQNGDSAADATMLEDETKDSIVDTAAEQKASAAQVDHWKAAFREVASIAGFVVPQSRDPDVPQVLDVLRALRSSESSLKEALQESRRREASLQVALADKTLEAISLRRELTSAFHASDPAIIQLKQLVLDSATNREFQSLRSDLEDTQKELRHVQEELQAATFTQESKAGRALMAKCRSLQEENEEMGRELSEGRGALMESQLSVARAAAEELRRSFGALREHCGLLDEENEELTAQLVGLRRQLQELQAAGGVGPAGMPGALQVAAGPGSIGGAMGGGGGGGMAMMGQMMAQMGAGGYGGGGGHGVHFDPRPMRGGRGRGRGGMDREMGYMGPRKRPLH